MSSIERRIAVPPPRENEPDFVHLSVAKNGSVKMLPPDTKSEREFFEIFEAYHAKLRAMHNDTDGIELGRLQAFGEQIGATSVPVQFLDEDSYQEALKGREGESDPQGIYLPLYRVALVRRNLALEALNGTEITESFAVHEAAHSDHVPTPVMAIHTKTGKLFKKSEVHMKHVRFGYSVHRPQKQAKPYGYLFEEGYAELQRSKYVEQHNLTGQFTEGAFNLDIARNSGLPLHYWYKDESTDKGPRLTFTPGALAATVFELLINEEPSLYSALAKGRRSADGLRYVSQTINKLAPGAYSELQHADDSAVVDLLIRLRKRFRKKN